MFGTPDPPKPEPQPDPQVEAAKASWKSFLARRKGFQSTNPTGGQGLLSPASVQTKQLLGQ